MTLITQHAADCSEEINSVKSLCFLGCYLVLMIEKRVVVRGLATFQVSRRRDKSGQIPKQPNVVPWYFYRPLSPVPTEQLLEADLDGKRGGNKIAEWKQA